LQLRRPAQRTGDEIGGGGGIGLGPVGAGMLPPPLGLGSAIGGAGGGIGIGPVGAGM
jgi:hypothetical protein